MAYNPFGFSPFGIGNNCPNYGQFIITTPVYTPVFVPVQQPPLIFTPRDNIQPQRQITTSSNSIKFADKKWSSKMNENDKFVKICRSDGKITKAQLYGYPEWDFVQKKWFAWVKWTENGTNQNYYNGQILNKRILLNTLLEINTDNIRLQFVGRKLLNKKLS